jgi:peptidoglycan/xylan/chitin deacetylase (PgdA/CDA1 family)
METFPGKTRMVVDAGHEVGAHGYSHENPIAMTREQESAPLDRSIELIDKLTDKLTGNPPTGYVAPWWEFSPVTNELLLERGIKYDHSLMHKDFTPYYVRVGDRWTKIDYDKPAEEWIPRARRGDQPGRDAGELVPRRPAADNVRQGQRQQPRFRQPS